MALIQVTAAQLRAKASELRSANGNFKSQVGSLESQEGSLASMWEGEAKNAFHTAFMNDKAQMDKFYDLIEQYCRTLEDIAQKYEQAEAVNTQTASNRTYR